MDNNKFVGNVHMAVIICITCGVTFAMPESLRQTRKNDHKVFYCPNGHKLHYPGKSDIEKLEEQLQQKDRALLLESEQRMRCERKIEEKSNQVRALKGVVTKKKRALEEAVAATIEE